MAVMNPYQQRLLMQQLARRDPTAIARLAGAQGGGLAGLVGGPQGGDMSLLGLVEPAQMVTPGSPAPMQPGREVMAPPPQQQAEQVAPVGPGYRKDGAIDQAVMTPEALQGLASARSAAIEDRIRAAAVVSPKMAEMLAGREERYSKELTDIEEDQKRTGWEALAMAGMRMAQSQSPYFMSALATGLEAGLTGYSAKKAAAAERKARLQEQKENVELYREQLKMQAEDREAARVARQMGITKEQLGLTEASTRAALGLATFQPSVEVAEMEPEEKRAAIDYTVARTEGERAGTALTRARTGVVGMGGSEGGGGAPARGQTVTANQLSAIENDYIKAMNEYNKINRRWVQAGKPNVNDSRPRNAVLARELIDAQRAWEAQERRLNKARGITVAPIGRSGKPAAGRSLEDILREYGG